MIGLGIARFMGIYSGGALAIIKADLDVNQKIRFLYKSISENNQDNLDEVIQKIEELTDSVDFSNEETRKNLITLESIARAKKDFQIKKGKNFSSYLTGLITQDKKIDTEEDSPFISEEGTFHKSSLEYFKVKTFSVNDYNDKFVEYKTPKSIMNKAVKVASFLFSFV